MSNVKTRKQKIIRIIRDNYGKGVSVCVKRLNDGGFPCPTGKKHQWTKDQVELVRKTGNVTIIEPKKTLTIATDVCRKTYDIIRQNSAYMTDFLRTAIREKIERDGLDLKKF